MDKVSEITSSKLSDAIVNYKQWGQMYYNVQNYGVFPNGTNVTSSLQALVTKAVSENRTAIYFPPGQYVVTGITGDSSLYYLGDNASFTGGYAKLIYPIGASSIQVPDATTTQKGVSVLDNAVDSTSQTKSATPLAVKTVRDQLLSSLTPGTRIMPTLFSGWINRGGGDTNLSYWKDANGYVNFEGNIKSGTVNSQVCSVAVGYRPGNTMYFLLYGFDGTNTIPCRVSLTPTGALNMLSGTNVHISFDGMRPIRAEA